MGDSLIGNSENISLGFMTIFQIKTVFITAKYFEIIIQHIDELDSSLAVVPTASAIRHRICVLYTIKIVRVAKPNHTMMKTNPAHKKV
jgi:hypothetical protein